MEVLAQSAELSSRHKERLSGEGLAGEADTGVGRIVGLKQFLEPL